MNIENIIKEYPLPEKYRRNGKECFYDTYRAKLIPATPEEIVRQKIAYWCERNLQVPPHMIILEQHLSHYQIPSKDRADIIIHEETEDGSLLPLAIIECKATTVALSEKTLHQCFSYSDLLQTDYAIVTNGIELLAYKYNAETNKYDLLSEPPTYAQMLGRKAEVAPPLQIVPRPKYESLFSEDIQRRYIEDYIIGSKTTIEYRAYAINILEALLDEEHTLQKRNASFELIKDLGVRILSYGNAAGFDYVAPYRSFLIKDKTGNNQIISLGFNAYGNDKTILCVAIDDFKKSLNGNKNLYTCDNAYNTRCTSFTGLPVGPISNPGIESIEATINYDKHDSYYFVADCKGKTYLNKDATGHYNIINRLKNEGNWCA